MAPGHIHQEIKMTEEIGTEDGMSDIRDEKDLSEGLPESQVEGAGCGTEGRTGQQGNWQDTDFSSGVHQEAQATQPVGNKEQVTR